MEAIGNIQPLNFIDISTKNISWSNPKFIVLSSWMALLRPSADIPHIGTQKDIYGLKVA